MNSKLYQDDPDVPEGSFIEHLTILKRSEMELLEWIQDPQLLLDDVYACTDLQESFRNFFNELMQFIMSSYLIEGINLINVTGSIAIQIGDTHEQDNIRRLR